MIGNTEFTVSARLDADGEVSAKVTGSCAYGNRTASVSADVTDKKLLSELGKSMKKAVTDAREELNQEATSAAAQSLVVATNKGEKL